jgi:PBSX family phage terminase large subunit
MTIEIPIEFKRLFDRDWREAAVYGGRFSLKSHTVARFLLIRARQEKTRVGCFREMQNSIAESSHQLLKDLIDKYKLKEFEVTENSIVNRINGSDFLFKGLHRNEQSIKSIEGIDIAWCEESQSMSESSIEVLTPTVRKPGSQIIYTYNRLEEEDPVHKRLVIEGRPNTLIINVNYHTALKYGMMPEEMRLEMEDDRERRPSLYRHKWLGEPNKNMERRIYKDWSVIDDVPHEAKLVRYGLDFGYSNDPSALVAIYSYNGGYILDERLYLKGQSNKQIADTILAQAEHSLVVADSSEPKSIDEIKSYGVSIVGAKKQREKTGNYKTYNAWAIAQVQDKRISITKRSLNGRREYNTYYWMVDKDGKILNIPEDFNNHFLDASKYGIISLIDATPDSVLNRQEETFDQNFYLQPLNSTL